MLHQIIRDIIHHQVSIKNIITVSRLRRGHLHQHHHQPAIEKYNATKNNVYIFIAGAAVPVAWQVWDFQATRLSFCISPWRLPCWHIHLSCDSQSLPKFNSSPLKSYPGPIGKLSSLPTTIFQEFLFLKFGGVAFKPRQATGVFTFGREVVGDGASQPSENRSSLQNRQSPLF